MFACATLIMNVTLFAFPSANRCRQTSSSSFIYADTGSGDEHPLHNKWVWQHITTSCAPLTVLQVWWYDFNARSASSRERDFRQSLKIIASIASVEAFWAVFNRVQLPSQARKSKS